MWKTHTLSLGWRVEKKHLDSRTIMAVHCRDVCPGQWVYICTARGTRGARAVTDGMSHWRLLRHPDPGSLQICRHSLQLQTAVYVTWCNSKGWFKKHDTKCHGLRDNDGKWRHPYWWMKNEESSWVCGQLVSNLKCDSVNDSDYDEQIIYWFRSEWLPGYLRLIRGAESSVWYQAIITSVTVTRCDPGRLCHNPTSLGAVKHKMVNIRTCLFLFSLWSPVSNCYCCVKYQLSFFV